jgi:hypothetical protein
MNININCPIGGTGYGIAALNIIKELNKQSKVSLFHMGNPIIDNQSDYDIIAECINRQADFDYNAPFLKIWHQFDLAGKIGNSKYFAYPFFESTKFSNRELHHLKFPNHIIVSSSWAKDIVLQNKIDKPISVVPLGVDRSIFNQENFGSNNINDRYIFITVGKWEKRKSHDVILELFEKAFDTNDSVELWMVTHNPFLDEEKEQYWMDMVSDNKMKSKIKIFPRLSSQSELARVISYSHCGLYISRAEGWNLDLIETMSMGKPVIVTNYSAHTEFCNSDNSYLVDIDSMESAKDDLWFNGTGEWAKIGQEQKDQIIAYMRDCYKNRILTNDNGIKTAEEFSWKNSADKLLGCMRE